MKKHIPNIITTARLILAFLFPIVFLYNIKVAAIIFLIASLSDSIDGVLARKWNVVSQYGKTIDPVADKLMVFFALLLATLYINNFLLITFALELLIAIVNIYNYKNTKKINVIKWGKIKAIFLYPLVLIGLVSLINYKLNALFYILFTMTTILQIITIIKYANYVRPKKMP